MRWVRPPHTWRVAQSNDHSVGDACVSSRCGGSPFMTRDAAVSVVAVSTAVEERGVVDVGTIRAHARSMRAPHRWRFLQSDRSGNRDACVSSGGGKSAFLVRSAAVSVVVVGVEVWARNFSVNARCACALNTRSAPPVFGAVGQPWRRLVMYEFSGRLERPRRRGGGAEGRREEGWTCRPKSGGSRGFHSNRCSALDTRRRRK
jgi:hypothetical protein